LKRRISIELGGKEYAFKTDESPEAVQKAIERVEMDFQRFGKFKDSNESSTFDEILVLLLLIYSSKVGQLEEHQKDLEERLERLLLEMEGRKADRSDMVS
jgi:cell division protein ZapA (FtsZ GTPase activity inhibitor)